MSAMLRSDAAEPLCPYCVVTALRGAGVLVAFRVRGMVVLAQQERRPPAWCDAGPQEPQICL